MEFILITCLSLLILFILVLVLLPSKKSTTKSIEFDANLSEVWQVYTDFESQTNWREEVVDIEVIEKDTKWIEYLKGNIKIHFEIISIVEKEKLEMKTFTPNAFEGKYIASFKSLSKTKTVGKFTEVAHTKNLLAKLIRLIFVDQEKLIDQYAYDAMKEIIRRRNES